MEQPIMPAKPSKAAGLTASLVTRKGHASPAAHAAVPATGQKHAGKSGANVYYKALTLKLDKARYQALKQLGLKEDKSSQELLTKAVDALLQGQSESAR